ncbi:tricarballylate utilization 4Fe-4S protein TcuB [Campylobacter sp. MIT 99-7217]|uniref:tricarballylate utilization 4Fe-4S protein TcuB n=1 Tax=Campylobacter sp. MIT 99-7217 TaxID=535091 RepID=UPI001159C8D6|nr:tricarballylate utilization 4Fe-4S protein TcuB [Campylobacter sp. MIT 99-7217]TQR33075.1 tricarballylate utilization 4Fe-4S protein TcuB [Campylobacter sp. MIT 99-7217]
MSLVKIYEEGIKSSIICNSCRYCEGLCAVFPAMEQKRSFLLEDMDYLANLCHQCSECFYDCQYAPPHEFNVSLPTQFARIREQSYKKYAFPSFLSKAFDKNALLTSLLLLLFLFLGFVGASMQKELDLSTHGGDFFVLIPYDYMVGVFSVVGVLVFVLLLISIMSYAKAICLPKFSLAIFMKSLKDALSLKYLGGHKNEGCTYPKESRSNIRKYFHHLTAYGFIFCFIATNLGAFYTHFLNLHAPYDFTQLPKLFGFSGGIMLCLGTAGLFVLKILADEELVDKKSVKMDYAFLIMLFLASFTGLILMALRQSELLSYTLWLHLSTVLCLFIMMPYSKFVHMFYRFLALLKFNTEEAH